MDRMSEIVDRVRPATEVVPLDGTPLITTLLIAAVAVTVTPLWRALRVAVTLVHELGHAFVGVLAGRTFTGFVVRGDMSGHAVTVGPARGFGRVATTWAGYPMPAVVGAVMVLVAESGYAAVLLTTFLALLAVVITRRRSALTILVMALTLAALGSLWWFRDDALQTHVLVGTGVVLIAGAWRHLAAVTTGPGDRGSAPAGLARLTWVPRFGGILSFAVVIGLATAGAGLTIYQGLVS